MKRNRLQLPHRFILLFTISSLLFSQPASAASLVQGSSTPPADQVVVSYSGNTSPAPAAPKQTLPYPVQTPTLLATWQAPANGPDAPLVAGVEDRDNTTPTTWWSYTGQTLADVLNIVNAFNARIVDLEADTSVNPIRYTVTYVENAGAYGSAWWFYVDVNAAALSSALTANNARLTVLKAYDNGSETHFFAVMVPNTGADAKGWWWYYNQTISDVTNAWQANNARLVQVNSYETAAGKRYAVVMISNTAADAKSWWWYVGASPSDVSAHLSANSARLLDIDYDEASTSYNVIMVGCSGGCPDWWWYYGVPVSDVIQLAQQDGARVIDFNPVPCGGNTCFTMVLINNSNAETTRVGNLLRNSTDGTVGLYLQQIGGAALASLMDTTTFEPASTIKIATHLYTFRQIQAGTVTLDTSITKYFPPASGSCPGNTPNGVEAISLADQEMMWHSDNTRTRELNDYFDVANVNLMLSSIGMTHSAINHVVGCGGPIENATTLQDLALLYEGVAQGTLLDPSLRSTFYDHMAGKGQFSNEGYDWTGLWSTDIPAIIDQEAPAGMSFVEKSAFLAHMGLAYKAGNYKICTDLTCTTYKDHISIFGTASIPQCIGQPQQYVFGVYIYNATSDTSSANAFNLTKAELLRGPIHDGLANWTCSYTVYVPLVQR
jgi:hypothetical protein